MTVRFSEMKPDALQTVITRREGADYKTRLTRFNWSPRVSTWWWEQQWHSKGKEASCGWEQSLCPNVTLPQQRGHWSCEQHGQPETIHGLCLPNAYSSPAPWQLKELDDRAVKFIRWLLINNHRLVIVCGVKNKALLGKSNLIWTCLNLSGST